MLDFLVLTPSPLLSETHSTTRTSDEKLKESKKSQKLIEQQKGSLCGSRHLGWHSWIELVEACLCDNLNCGEMIRTFGGLISAFSKMQQRSTHASCNNKNTRRYTYSQFYTMSKPPFLNVALELWNKIYEEILVSKIRIEIMTEWGELRGTSTNSTKSFGFWLLIPRVNKQINLEACTILYSKNAFTFTTSCNTYTLIPFLDKIGAPSASFIRRICIEFPTFDDNLFEDNDFNESYGIVSPIGVSDENSVKLDDHSTRTLREIRNKCPQLTILEMSLQSTRSLKHKGGWRWWESNGYECHFHSQPGAEIFTGIVGEHCKRKCWSYRWCIEEVDEPLWLGYEVVMMFSGQNGAVFAFRFSSISSKISFHSEQQPFNMKSHVRNFTCIGGSPFLGPSYKWDYFLFWKKKTPRSGKTLNLWRNPRFNMHSYRSS